jgi:hypothetical protein
MRNKHAGLLMIEAIFDEWLEGKGWDRDTSFEFSREIASKIASLEKEGYLVFLRQEAACHVVEFCAECEKIAKHIKLNLEKSESS